MGLVTKITDASGTISYRYGKLGETTEETRTLAVKNGTVGQTMTATTGYVSNYLGQMENVTYPDGEAVTYGYDGGGQVVSVIGRHYGHDFVYVSDIGYDEFAQRTYITYGTGVRTDYAYDENRRWLSSIETNKGQKKYQNISYSFDLVGNVLGYTNDCTSGGGYRTSQSYSYDSLYQLISATGSTLYEPVAGGAVPEHESTYTQAFAFDILGNMTSKTSTETVYPNKTVGDALNYSINFSYADGFAHRLDHAGQRYYAYDADGNVIRERNGEIPNGGNTGSGDGNDDEWDDWDDDWGDGQGEAGFGFGMGGSGSGSGSGSSTGSGGQATVYERIYEWNERDRLTVTTEGTKVVGYVYGEDGKRTNKYSSDGETVYFSDLWSWHDGGNLGTGGQTTKNIYLGTECIVSKLNRGGGLGTYSEEYHKTYYWHSDHLGSAHFITDYQGNEYQRIEYTPYGEEWVELKPDAGEVYLPYRFTGKERDEETGLYYYGARYLDPVYSRWLSTDPELGDYLPSAPTSDEARKRNQNLPGMGGVFNTINMQMYHYAGNNPITYKDPNGRVVFNTTDEYVLLRIEDKGYVVLAPYSIYTGKNITYAESYVNKDTGILDKGKIDGVIFSTGKICKITGKSYCPGKTDIYITKDESGIRSTYTIGFCTDSSNNFSNFYDFCNEIRGKETSGFYNVGGESGASAWLKRSLSQDEMKKICNGADSVFIGFNKIEEMTKQGDQIECYDFYLLCHPDGKIYKKDLTDMLKIQSFQQQP